MKAKRPKGLKNCPFCGCCAVLMDLMGYGRHWQACTTCNAVGPGGAYSGSDDPDKAMAQWNRRADDPYERSP
jgi:Lar family restriction alleviation protein